MVVALPPRATTMAVIMALFPPGNREEAESSERRGRERENEGKGYLLPFLPRIKLVLGERATSNFRWHMKSLSCILSMTPASATFWRKTHKLRQRTYTC